MMKKTTSKYFICDKNLFKHSGKLKKDKLIINPSIYPFFYPRNVHYMGKNS
jgi:hypothetical protein